MKPDQLAKLNITVPEIITAVNSQNTVNPGRQDRRRARAARDRNSLTRFVHKAGCTPQDEFGEIVLRATPDGSMVRLKDVARIELGAAELRRRGPFQRQARARLSRLYQLPGSNAIEAADGVEEQHGRVEESVSRRTSITSFAIDTTLAVTEGIVEIGKTFWEALVLVMLVVFIFLQGWRAALIPLLAVPVSLVGTFAFFPLFGFSMNTLSLFGLVLAIGLVVDDAIVVVEAVEHHIEEGMSPREATFKAMEEVAGRSLPSRSFLSAVFVPTVFIPGITGRLYQQFAVTIAVSVLISAFNALTLRPRYRHCS